MTTVLTGATGFLGSRLLLRLLRQGRQVTALVRRDRVVAEHRLVNALRSTGADTDDLDRLSTQVTVQPVDVTAPLLGLTPARHRALAEASEQIWHAAAVTALTWPLHRLTPVNVHGTQAVTRLAQDRPGAPVPLVHVSTAFVAGGRLSGTVGEDDLDDAHGFLCPYEHSKYLAERWVRDWAEHAGAAVLVIRPSILVDNRPLSPAAPRHTLRTMAVHIDLAASQGPAWLAEHTGTPRDPDGGLTLRTHLTPGCATNLLPVDYAADAMLRIIARGITPGVRTCQVVHPVNTPVELLLRTSVEPYPWLRLEFVPELIELGPLEEVFLLPTGGAGYGRSVRRYDRTTLDRLDADAGVAAPAALDHAYLAAAFGHHPVPLGEALASP